MKTNVAKKRISFSKGVEKGEDEEGRTTRAIN